MTEINLFDQTLKIIARDYADTFLQIAFPDKHIELIGTLENVELALPMQWVNFVHKIKHNNEEYIFHLEFQWQHKTDYPEQLCIYHGILLKQFDEKIITVVLYIKPRKTKPTSEYNVSLGDTVINRFTYPVIQLKDYVEQIRSGQYRELAPLLSVLVANPDETVLQEEQALILGEDDPQKQADLFALAFAIGLRDFDEKVVERIFRKEINKMKQSSLITSWLQEKLEEGREEGVKKGRIEEAHKSILLILSMRFNRTLSQLTPLKSKLQVIRDLNVLEKFIGYAVQDHTIDDFSVRLGNVEAAG